MPLVNQRMRGSGKVIQSFDMPRRTTKALVKAAKAMVVAASSTNSPVMDARREAPRPSEPPPPPKPPPRGGAGGLITSDVIEPGMNQLCRRHVHRVGLHDVVARGARHAVFVWTMVDHGVMAA